MDERTLDRIYAAAVDETAMHEALADLALACASRSAGLFRIHQGVLDWERSVGMPERFMPEFARDYARFDPRIEYILRFPVHTVMSDTVPQIRREMQAGPVAQFVEAHDLHYTSGALLENNNGELLNLYISRSADQGTPDDDTLARLAEFVPHFARSMQLKQWHAWVQGQTCEPAHAVSRPPRGRVLIDDRARVRWLDAPAESLFRTTGAARLFLGRIAWHDDRAERWFEQSLALARASRRPDWPVRHFHLSQARGLLHLSMAPAEPPPQLPLPLVEPARSWLMVLLEWRTIGDSTTTRLTPCQRKVLQSLARGFNTAEVARQLGCAHNTARNHAQALLKKFGVSTRIEMINKAHEAGLLDS